jgi:dipeptidyl aminopeptidase/acylaminoacyl peptidase
VATWRSPVLLIHGDDDRNVPFAQTELLVDALRRQKVDFEELIFPDEIHEFLLCAGTRSVPIRRAQSFWAANWARQMFHTE